MTGGKTFLLDEPKPIKWQLRALKVKSEGEVIECADDMHS
jgi:hypothetical protein